MLNPRISSHVALFLVALIYGANYSISKIAMDDGLIDPMSIVWLRIGFGAIIFSSLYLIFVREKIDRKDLRLFILCSLTGVTLNMSLFFTGLHYTNPINASLVMVTTPIIVLVFSYVLLKEYITKLNVAGIFLALIGAIILVYKPETNFSLSSMKGDLMVFANACFYGLYLVLVKKLLLKYHAFTVLMGIFSFGFLFILPVGFFTFPEVQWAAMNSKIIASLVFILICTTCLTYLLNLYALKTVKASTAGTYIYLQPLLASFFAILLQKDVLNVKMLISSALIFGGLYLVSKKNQK